jgi:alanine dehydrogenase
VSRLVQHGHEVLLEQQAGEEAHFSDHDYEKAGGRIVYSAEEIHQRADLVCRVARLDTRELDLLKPRSTVCAFHHLAIAPHEQVRRLMELETTIIAYEMIQDEWGDRPVLVPFSEMAGQLAVHLAAWYLQEEAKGRGVLLGNVPGVPPSTVIILGGGTVGRTAARQALASGAHVIILDDDVRKLRDINRELKGRAVTAVASHERLEQFTPIADVLIGAILIPGERAPFLVTEAMVKKMKQGSVILDVSIDQGGCVETSRPTSPDEPTFVVHGVVHYCVPNMTASIPRTASRALVNAALPYLQALADKGPDAALRDDPWLARGVQLYRGKVVHESVGRTLDIPASRLGELLGEGDSA